MTISTVTALLLLTFSTPLNLTVSTISAAATESKIVSDIAVVQSSPDLTSEEKVLLQKLLSDELSTNASTGSGGRRLQPLNDLLRTLDSDLKALTDLSGNILHVESMLNNLSETFDDLQKESSASTTEIKDFNSIEMQNVKDQLDKFESFVRDEFDQVSSFVEKQDEMEEEDDKSERISFDALENAIQLDDLIDEAEFETDYYINSKLKKEMEDELKRREKEYTKQVKELELSLESKLEEVKHQSTNQCADTLEVAALVQSTLWSLKEDGEKYDHLQNAMVVYGSDWTSDTFRRKIPKRKVKRLGDVEWRSYFPEDWERMLPLGWEDWDISFLQNFKSLKNIKRLIPTSVLHSLPMVITAKLEQSTSYSESIPPPEMIFNPNTNLGSCWPMKGTNGKITLRLPYPVAVESITVSHYSGTNYKADKLSAPRHFKLTGYPPCSDGDNDNDCQVIGFDKDDSINLGSFEYRIVPLPSEFDEEGVKPPTRSSQLFHIGSGSSDNSPILHEEEEDENDESYGFEDEVTPMQGSCTSSCAPDFGDLEKENIIEAITIQIHDNWGNPDLTCIYRISLQGEASDSEHEG